MIIGLIGLIGFAFASQCHLVSDERRLAPPPLEVPTACLPGHAVACLLRDARALEQHDREAVPG